MRKTSIMFILYPCDCNNCKSFELTLKNNARKLNLEKDYERYKKGLQDHHPVE